MIRVLVADDQRVVRDGLVMLVGLVDGLEVAGTAEDGAVAVRLAAELRPDVVLMDLRMPVMDGAAATRAIRTAENAPEVLVLTTYADDASLLPALQAGARGYLTKDAGLEEIETAVRAVHAGHTHLDPAVQARLVALAVTASTDPATSQPTDAHDLTPREVEVLRLIAAGASNADIARELVVSAATVKTHVNRVFAKTGARDRAQAVRWAYRSGLASP